MDEIKQEREALDAQTAAWLEKVAAYDRSEEWRTDGYWSAAAAISAECRMDKGVASATVKLACKLEKLPVVAAVFAEGAISQRHVSVIATAATAERMAEFANREDEFVDVARKCAPKELASIVRYVTDALDGDSGVAAEDAIFQRRRYSQSRTLDEMLATRTYKSPGPAKKQPDRHRSGSSHPP